jgi:hypothetical protein
MTVLEVGEKTLEGSVGVGGGREGRSGGEVTSDYSQFTCSSKLTFHASIVLLK